MTQFVVDVLFSFTMEEFIKLQKLAEHINVPMEQLARNVFNEGLDAKLKIYEEAIDTEPVEVKEDGPQLLLEDLREDTTEDV